MFGQAEKKKMLKDMTFTPIQGFPKEKKDQTIQEIVREIKLADEKSLKKAESLENEKHISLERLEALKTAQRGGTSNDNDIPEKINPELLPQP